MSKAADEAILQELHKLVADTLKTQLKDEPSPQMLAQAIKFLKDNGIEPARDTDNKALRALSEQIDKISASDDPDALQDFMQ